MVQGKVKWFNGSKGFGFLMPDDESGEVFVHHTGIIADKQGQKTLADGDRVEFDVEKAEKGPRAVNVKKIQ